MSFRYFSAVLSALFLLHWLGACSAQPHNVTATPAVPLPTQTLPLTPTLPPPVSLTATPPAQPASAATPTPAPTLTPSPRSTVGRLNSEENGVFHAPSGEATEQVLKPATRGIGQGDETWTDQQGRALLTFVDLMVRIYRDSRLQTLDVTPAGLKLALGQGAVLVGQAPQSRQQVVLVGDPPRARIVVTGTVPAPSGHQQSKPRSAVTPMPRLQAPVATTASLTPGSLALGAGQQAEAVYFVASQLSADSEGMAVVRPVSGAIELSAYSGASTGWQAFSAQSPMWVFMPSVGQSGSAPPPRAVTYAELRNLVRDESYWSLIRDIELDAACLSEGRLPLTSEQAQGIACPLPSLTVASPPVYQCINPIFRVTLSGQAAPGCLEALLSCLVWEWGDGTVDVQAFPANHDFASAGKYTVTVKAYDSLGQTSSLQVPLKVACPTAVPERPLPFVKPFTSPLPVEQPPEPSQQY